MIDPAANMSTANTLVDNEKHDPNGPNGYDHAAMLERVRTSGSVTIPPEMFEQMFLSPQNRVKGDLRQTFGNPTGIAIAGFLLCTTPLSMVLLGWQGSGGLGAANVGTYFSFGGTLMCLGGLLEWVMGNTFPSTVFLTFGAFWLTFGITLVPYFNASGAYATSQYSNGMENPEFAATFAFFLLAMIILVLVFCIASLRTNVCFFVIFLTLLPTFGTLCASFFALSKGKMSSAAEFQKVGAGLLLAVSFIGWWIFLALMLSAVDFPVMVPLGDLSTIIKGRSERMKAKETKGDKAA